MRPLLQGLSDYTDGGMLEAALADLTAAVGGELTFGVLIGGALILSLYLAGNRDLTVPAVVTVLVGGVLFPVLPATYSTIATTIVFLGIVVSVLVVLEQYYLEGAQ